MKARVRLSEVGTVIRGVSYDPARDLRTRASAATVDLLRANNVQQGTVILGDVQHVLRNRVRADQLLRPDDILICAANGSRRLVGKSAQVTPSLGAGNTFGAFMLAYRPDPKRVLPSYISQVFQSEGFRATVDLALAGSSINNLGASAVLNHEIDLPSRENQEEIARALRRADDLVSGLQTLIAKKRMIQVGLIQELLTQRSRLPGFTQAWAPARVGDLLEFKNGLNKGSEFFGHGTPIVNFMDVMRSPIVTAEAVAGLVSVTRDEARRYSARRGDIFFTRTSETVEEVGTAAVLTESIPSATFSGFVLRGRPRTPHVNSAYIAWAFQTEQVRQQVQASASYTTRALTNGRSLGRVELMLPERVEQDAIVEVLSAAATEILRLENRLEKARSIKRGMAQTLLTGRTRLPQEVAA